MDTATQWTILVISIVIMSNIMFYIMDPAYRRMIKTLFSLMVNIFKIGNSLTKATYYNLR